MTSPYALGATLYMPATRPDLFDIVRGGKIPGLRSLVICLEDAVADGDVNFGMSNLQGLLRDLSEHEVSGSHAVPLVFVRPRHTDMGLRIAGDWPLASQLDGFVLPKFRLDDLETWRPLFQSPHWSLMPTLETAEVFDSRAMQELRDALAETHPERILALRIGGNDLLAALGLRRHRSLTIYQSPVGYVIGMLTALMGSAGFALTAPVCERMDNPDLLQAELELDMAHGLVGKTAIHPGQLAVIHRALKVPLEDYEAAMHILNELAPAVFKHDGAMLEPATHRAWAVRMVERASHFGIEPSGGRDQQHKIPA